MKTSIICVLALMAVANGQEETKVESNNETRPRECEPGSTKMIECNTCFCDEKGYAWACTLMGCLGPVAVNSKGDSTQLDDANPVDRVRRETDVRPVNDPAYEPCVPGTTKKIECNDCFCAGGLGWACTKIGCHDVVANPAGTATLPDGEIH